MSHRLYRSGAKLPQSAYTRQRCTGPHYGDITTALRSWSDAARPSICRHSRECGNPGVEQSRSADRAVGSELPRHAVTCDRRLRAHTATVTRVCGAVILEFASGRDTWCDAVVWSLCWRDSRFRRDDGRRQRRRAAPGPSHFERVVLCRIIGRDLMVLYLLATVAGWRRHAQYLARVP